MPIANIIGTTISLTNLLALYPMPSVLTDIAGTPLPLNFDGSGNLKITVSGGSTGNPAAGLTGSPVPTNADYVGFNSGGNLVGVSSVNPLPVSASITSNNITQFGGNNVVTGTGASGLGIPRVTVSNDSNILVSQSTTPWSDNVSQWGGIATSLGQKVSASSVPVVIASDQSAIAVDDGDVVDTNNSTSATLGSNGVFTGTATIVTAFSQISVFVFTDQNSASNGLQIQFSIDGTNWDYSNQENVVANQPSYWAITPKTKYYRIIYTNGTVAQTAFRLQTILKPVWSNGLVQGIDLVPLSTDDVLLVKSVISGKTTGGGGGYVDVKVNPSGTLTVDASNSSGLTGTFTANQGTPNTPANAWPVSTTSSGTSKTLKSAVVSISSSGDNTIVAAVPGFRIKVCAFTIQCTGTPSTPLGVKFKDGAAADLTGVFTFNTREGIALGTPVITPLFATSASNALILNLSQGVTVAGFVSYWDNDAT